MAIVKMKKLKLMVASSQREELLRELMLLGCVEVSHLPQPEDGENAFLSRAEVPDQTRRRTEQALLANSISVLKKYAPEKGGMGAMLSPLPDVKTEDLLDETSLAEDLDLAREILSLDERIRKNGIEKNAALVEIQGMGPWIGLDLPMEMSGTETTAVVRGTMPAAVEISAAQAALNDSAELAGLMVVSSDKSYHYLVLVSHREQLDAAQAALRSLGFAVMSTSEYKGTAAEIIERDEKAIAAGELDSAECCEKLVQMAQYREKLKLRFDTLTTLIARADAESRILCTESVSLFEGWVPAEQEADLAALLEKYDAAWETADPAEEEYAAVPVKLRNGKLSRSLNAVTEMYSLPAYDGIDPNPYMAPFFIFFYGMMMADMGYGLLMILVCLLVLKKKKPAGTMRNFFELFLWCGISTLGWGAITGGFFGDAPYQVAKILNPETTFQGLPALISPLEDTVMILVGAVALGFVHLVTGMAIGFVYNLKRGDWKTALNDQLAWWVVFAGIGCAVLGLGPWVLALGGVLVVAPSSPVRASAKSPVSSVLCTAT